MDYDDLPHIYFYTVDVSFKKGKTMYNRTVKLVTRCRTPGEVMRDPISMERIRKVVYAKKYKGQKHVMVRRMYNEVQLGKVTKKAL